MEGIANVRELKILFEPKPMCYLQPNVTPLDKHWPPKKGQRVYAKVLSCIIATISLHKYI